MIRPERLTVKAAEALQQAGTLARTRGNPVVNDAHLFHALLSQDDGIVVPLLQKAGLNVAQLKADTEHLLLALAEEKGTTAKQLLSAAGVSRDDLLAALAGVRGSHRVTDQEPEQKYQALERFTRDLTEQARKTKLDPVIGRDEE